MSGFISFLPEANAVLNTISAFFLAAGFVLIRREKVFWHKICMLSAFAASVLFLVLYVYYHANAGIVRFHGYGLIRPVYFLILISHTILAAVVVPLILLTLRHAVKGSFEKHRWIAIRTLPIWLYVSVTGVAVYFLLFHYR